MGKAYFACLLALGLQVSACSSAKDTEERHDLPERDAGSSDDPVDARVRIDASSVANGQARSDAATSTSDARDHDMQIDASQAPHAVTDARVRDAQLPIGDGGLPPGVTEVPGPFATLGVAGSMEGPGCAIYRPRDLSEGGAPHPVIMWGMGTGGFNTYQGAFDLWASYGFVVTAALLGNGQGDGEEMIACMDYVCDHYAPYVDCQHAGASGHSQGGGGAIMAGRDARVRATAPIQAYTQQGFGGFDTASIPLQHGPMLLLSGSNDVIAVPAQNQQPVFDKVNQPVVWATLIGADHVTTGIDGAAGYRALVLAWFRLHLLEEKSLADVFYGPTCTLCSDAAWTVMRHDTDTAPW